MRGGRAHDTRPEKTQDSVINQSALPQSGGVPRPSDDSTNPVYTSLTKSHCHVNPTRTPVGEGGVGTRPIGTIVKAVAADRRSRQQGSS